MATSRLPVWVSNSWCRYSLRRLFRDSLVAPCSAPQTASASASEQGVDEDLQQLAQQVRARLVELFLKMGVQGRYWMVWQSS